MRFIYGQGDGQAPMLLISLKETGVTGDVGIRQAQKSANRRIAKRA
jgi:hypothetical protein